MKEKVLRSIFCFTQGDALAQESRIKEELSYSTKQGIWSSRTALILATLDAYRIMDGFSLMKNFTLFLEEGKYTAENIPTEVEETFYEAMNRFKRGVHPEDCGGKQEKDRSPGGLLRVLPLAIFAMKTFDLRKDKSSALTFIEEMVGCTHAHPQTKYLVRVYGDILWSLFYEKTDLHFWNRLEQEKRNIAPYQGEDAKVLLRTLELLEKSTSFAHSMELALAESHDPKSVAPLLATLTGLLYDDQPVEWMQVVKKTQIEGSVLQAWLGIM